MESVRYRFGPTSHDPLAQSPGRFTFFFDSQRRLWQVLGSEETRAETFVAPAAPDELCRSGIESEKPLALALQPILHPATLQPGRYTLCLWMLDPTSTAAGQRVFDVSVRAAAGPASIPDRIDIFKETGRTGRVLVRSYPIQVTRGGEVQVRLTPVAGKVVVCAAALEPADAEHGASVSRQKRILEQMRKVNAYQLTHPCMEEDDRNWQRGTWYTGVMAAYKASRDQRFLEQARQWGNRHRWQVGGRDSPANKLTCVQTWLELYAIDMDPAMYEPAVKWLNSGSPLTPSGAKVWYMEGGRRYADSLYVGPPALAMLARVTGDAKYLRWMHAFFWDVHAELFDKEAGLFYRDKRFIGQTTPNGKKILWSRGNGWVMGGIVRILEYLPADDPQRARYVELLKAMAAAVARTQGADGLWRSNLDDPKQFPDPESSGSGFFCYAFAWGINHGVLDPVVYAPGAHKAWAGLTNCVSPEGKLMWGQRVGDRPAAATQDQTYEFVTGTFLLAGSEILKLKP
jgi:rhamnogalacturonyl hydrolase YesR